MLARLDLSGIALPAEVQRIGDAVALFFYSGPAGKRPRSQPQRRFASHFAFQIAARDDRDIAPGRSDRFPAQRTDGPDGAGLILPYVQAPNGAGTVRGSTGSARSGWISGIAPPMMVAATARFACPVLQHGSGVPLGLPAAPENYVSCGRGGCPPQS